MVSFGLDISPKLLCLLIGLDIDRVIISFNNDSDKASNRGAIASVKNYLKLLSYFDVNKLSICLPVKNDFGEMSSEDFSTWSNKCSTERPDQPSQILSFAEKLGRSGGLAKNHLKNLKVLRLYGE